MQTDNGQGQTMTLTPLPGPEPPAGPPPTFSIDILQAAEKHRKEAQLPLSHPAPSQTDAARTYLTAEGTPSARTLDRVL